MTLPLADTEQHIALVKSAIALLIVNADSTCLDVGGENGKE